MATLPLNLYSLLRGNEYLSAVSIETNPKPNLVGTPIRKSDIGHEVNPGRLSSVSGQTGIAGFLVFYSGS
jgi:hypothetical protein